MTYKEFRMPSQYGTELFAYSWIPDSPVAAVQVAHGSGEHARRYDHFARFLSSHGFAVYANDHIGHGQTAGAPQSVGHFPTNRAPLGASWRTCMP